MSAEDIVRPQRRIAPLKEREEIEATIKNLEADEAGESKEFSREAKKLFSQELGGEASRNNRQLNRMQKILRNSEPEPLTFSERTRLEAEEKILIEQVQKRMVTKAQTRLTPLEKGTSNQNPEFNRAANQMARIEFSKETQEMAHRLKNIRRQLHPDDPEAGNLENIRPE